MSDDAKARILAAAPAPLELADRLGFKHRGGRTSRVRICCPWHNEKNASCEIAEKDGEIVVHCFSCHAGGGLFDLVAAVRGLDVRSDFPIVLEESAQVCGVAPPERHVARDRSTRHEPREPDPVPRAPAERKRVDLAVWLEHAAIDWVTGHAPRVPDDVEDRFAAMACFEKRTRRARRSGVSAQVVAPREPYETIGDIHAVLRLAGERRIDREAKAFAALERVGDRLEREGRLDWREP